MFRHERFASTIVVGPVRRNRAILTSPLTIRVSEPRTRCDTRRSRDGSRHDADRADTGHPEHSARGRASGISDVAQKRLRRKQTEVASETEPSRRVLHYRTRVRNDTTIGRYGNGARLRLTRGIHPQLRPSRFMGIAVSTQSPARIAVSIPVCREGKTALALGLSAGTPHPVVVPNAAPQAQHPKAVGFQQASPRPGMKCHAPKSHIATGCPRPPARTVI